eukprot:510135-Hanusia_phi.AAC.1
MASKTTLSGPSLSRVECRSSRVTRTGFEESRAADAGSEEKDDEEWLSPQQTATNSANLRTRSATGLPRCCREKTIQSSLVKAPSPLPATSPARSKEMKLAPIHMTLSSWRMGLPEICFGPERDAQLPVLVSSLAVTQLKPEEADAEGAGEAFLGLVRDQKRCKLPLPFLELSVHLHRELDRLGRGAEEVGFLLASLFLLLAAALSGGWGLEVLVDGNEVCEGKEDLR